MKNATLVDGAVPNSKRKAEGESQKPEDGGQKPEGGEQPLPVTARDHYLAEHPEARRLQDAQIAQITRAVSDWLPKMKVTVSGLIERTEEARQIGIAVVAFEETLAGKKLTVDFWQQLQHLFVDERGQHIARETLEWLVKIARRNPGPVDNLMTALQYRQELFGALQDDSVYKLDGGRVSPQVAHPPANPLSLLKDHFNFSRLSDTWNQLTSDPNYCPDGRLRADLRETLRAELEQAMELIARIRAELG